MNTMIIMIGLQASGKSTFCHTFLNHCRHISLDILHTRRKEHLAIASCIEQHEDFVVDNTNPSVEDRKKYFSAVAGAEYQVIGYYMKSVISECVQRNEQRTGKEKIPCTAIASTSKKLELPSYAEGFHQLYYVEIVDTGFRIHTWKVE